MPYYSELGLTSTPSTSAYSSLFLTGPYAKHSSIIASNFSPSYTKSIPRQFRGGYKPHLSSINELSSPLRRVNSPKSAYHSPKYSPRPIKIINTADIDVSVNRYSKFNKYERPKPDAEKSPAPKDKSPAPKDKSPSPRRENSKSSEEQREAKPNPTIRRDRPTVRLQTVHKDTLEKEIGAIKSWRDNFKPDELVVEAKRRKKTQGEILKEKFLIRSRSKENLLKSAEPEVTRRKSYKKSPSFHDICTAISSGDLEDDLNPGQPAAVQRRQSRQIPGEKILKEIRRTSTELSDEDLNILNAILTQKTELSTMPEDDVPYYSRESVRKKKATRKNSGTIGDIPSKCSDENNNSDYKLESPPTLNSTKKALKRTMSNGIIDDPDSLKEEIYKNVIRDISQVEIQQTKFKPKPRITSSVDEIGEPTTKLKPIVDEVEVEESPKMKKEKKFRFNVVVEIDNQRKPKPMPGKITFSEDMKGVVQVPKPKGTVVTSILKKRSPVRIGHIPEEKKKTLLADEKEFVQVPEPKRTVVTSILKKRSPVRIGHIPEEKNKILLADETPIKSEFITENVEYDNPPCENVEVIQPMSSTKKTPPVEVSQSIFTTKKDKSLLNKISTKKENHSAPELSEPKNGIKSTSPVSKKIISRSENNSAPTSINKKEANICADPARPITIEDIVSKNLGSEKPQLPKAENSGEGNVLTKTHVTSDLPTATSKPKLLNETQTKKQNYSAPDLCKKSEAGYSKSTPPLSPLAKEPKTTSSAPTSIHKIRAECSNSKDTTIEKTLGEISSEPKKILRPKLSLEQTSSEGKIESTVDSVPLSPEETAKRKLMSKRSLVQKASRDDPDLNVFVPPEPEIEPEPQPEADKKEVFVPLQSNRLSQWMHPWKKPEQLDECPVEIFARPKVIRGRHYPRPRGHAAQPPLKQESSSEEEEDDEDESDEDSSSQEESSSEELEDEYQGSTVSTKIGASTSSNDSGFGSGVPDKNKDCDVNIHKKCEKLTANLCGVNQKLVVEAIESVRKGSLDSRDSPTTNHANNPAFSLDFGDIPEEYSQSSTFSGFQKSGRITPPATTIPRFRKYCIDDFNFLKVLGKGSFGKVLLAELKETEYYYAVKCLKKDVVLEDDDVECTLIERKVLALGTKHPYLCHLLCTFQTESHLFFVMEYLNGGDLMFHIQATGRFPEHQARFYGAEIVSGLKFLHNKGIVYRDLKLDNILLDFDGHVRIADFGMCKLQIFLDRMAETFCGTPDYMAPEIIKGQHYNQCVDWWSFGVLLYEMLLGQSPFSGCDEDELFWSICNEKPVLPRFLSTEATSILTMFLEKDASKRLGNRFCPHGDIQDQPFFRAIDWYALEARQLEPPFKPNLQHPLDTQYFDKHFTVEKAKLTPIESTILQSMDQTQFQGFSYTNPNATDK